MLPHWNKNCSASLSMRSVNRKFAVLRLNFDSDSRHFVQNFIIENGVLAPGNVAKFAYKSKYHRQICENVITLVLTTVAYKAVSNMELNMVFTNNFLLNNRRRYSVKPF